MDNFTIKRGDTSPSIRRTLEDFAGPINLTGATVGFRMVNSEMELVVSRACTVESPATGGVVVYDWQTGDTAIAGVYFAEFEVTFADNSRETYPNASYIKITVDKDL